VIKEEGMDIFHSGGQSLGADIPGFCALLQQAIAACLETTAPTEHTYGEEQMLFMTKTLPKAVEILCKRQTKM